MISKRCVIIVLGLFVIFINCTVLQLKNITEDGDLMKLAINDFTQNERNHLAESKTYYVRSLEVEKSITGISIVAHRSTMHFDESSMNATDLKGPTGVFEVNGVLFYWDDPSINMSAVTLEVLKKYNMVLDDIEEYRDSLDKNEFADSEAIHYYFCNSNPTKFRKKRTKVALGYYDAPRIKCG